MAFVTFYRPDFPCWALCIMATRAFPVRQPQALILHQAGRVIARSPDLGELVSLGWPVERARAQVPQARVQAWCEGVDLGAWDLVLERSLQLSPWLEVLHDGRCASPAWLEADTLPETMLNSVAKAQVAKAGFRGLVGPPLAFRAAQHTAALFQVKVQPGQQDTQGVQTLTRELGFQAGLAVDRLASLFAALVAPQGTVLTLAPGLETSFVQRLPLSVALLTGVSAATLERLGWLGFSTLGDLHRLTGSQLKAQFCDGALVHALTQGYADPLIPYEAPPRLEYEFQADEPWFEPGDYEPVLWHLLEQACEALQGRVARLVQVVLFDTEGRKGVGRRWAHEATAQKRTLHSLAWQALRVARNQLEQAARSPVAASDPVEAVQEANSPPLALVACRLILAGLGAPQGVQACFLPQGRSLQKAIEQVESRHPGTSLRYVLDDAHAYLPERAYHLVPQTLRASQGTAQGWQTPVQEGKGTAVS